MKRVSIADDSCLTRVGSHDARRFVRLVIGLALTGWTFVASLNYLVNPYAQYAPKLLPPTVQTSRETKVALIDQMDQATAGLVLGSSRVLKIEPDYLQRRLGETFFNAGVNLGKPEDFLAFSRYFKNRFGRPPSTIVLGLDVHAFIDETPIDARLLSNRSLIDMIPEAITWSDRMAPWKELLSWQQSVHSAKSLVHRGRLMFSPSNAPSQSAAAQVAGDPHESQSFRADGVLVYHDRESQMARGIYDFETALNYNRREYLAMTDGFDRLSPRRMDLFRRLVAMCEEDETRLIVFLTPLHPRLLDSLNATQYSDRHAELSRLLLREAACGRFTFCDLSTVASFHGDPAQFLDGIHPLESNTRKMIDCLVRGQGNEGRVAGYVVQ